MSISNGQRIIPGDPVADARALKGLAIAMLLLAAVTVGLIIFSNNIV